LTAGAAVKANLTRLAFDKIRDAIVRGALDLGEPLSEVALAKALGVSKAPIRAAMSELRVKGLVEIVPHSGTYVFSPTREDIEHLCEFRFLLEGRALGDAMSRHREPLVADLRRVVRATQEAATSHAEWKRLDSEFHQLFVVHADNRYLADAYETIGHRVEALRNRFMDTPVYRNKACAEHEELLALLESNQVSKAVAVLGEHIARTRHFQSNVTWSRGRSRRSVYRFREHAGVFG
jgi:DNA-binding GntR family transcriptional regulator